MRSSTLGVGGGADECGGRRVHDAYQAFEADRESTASEREPLEYTPEEEEEEDYASEEQSYQDRLEAFSKPACEPAREEEDEYSDRGAYEESFEREEKKDKAVEVIELGSSSEDEEGADELQEYDSEEDLPTLSEVVARSRERPIEVREEEMEEGSQEGDDYSVYEDEERQPSTRVAPLSREESMDGSQEGDDCWIYDDDEELPTSAEVIARARAKQQQQPQDERSQEEYYADLDAALEPRSLPSPFVDLAQEESEELADARVEDAPSWLARRDEQEERAQDDYDSDLVVADEPTSLPSPLLGLEEELREEDLADPMAEDDDEEREPRIVVDSGARIPLVEYGSGSEEGTSERYTSRLEERWGVQAEESDGEEWFGQDASSDAGVAESGSEEGRRRRRERSIEVEKDDDGEVRSPSFLPFDGWTILMDLVAATRHSNPLPPQRQRSSSHPLSHSLRRLLLFRRRRRRFERVPRSRDPPTVRHSDSTSSPRHDCRRA